MNSEQIIGEMLAQAPSLKEIPTVALEVSRLLDNPDVDSHQLAEVIMKDPALVAKVLKICNSASYGLSRKIATMSEAISILGQKTLREIIYTIISHGVLNRPLHGYALEDGALWDNALTCAVYAKHIAGFFKFRDAELVFVAALLRDIGKVVMESYIGKKGLDLQFEAVSHRHAFTEAEEQVIGVSHTQVGLLLAKQWNLPDSLVLSIGYHHKPSDLPLGTGLELVKLVALVHLADTYTMMTGTGMGIDGLMYPLDAKIFEVLGCPQNSPELESLYAELLDLHDEVDAKSAAVKKN